jgi:predicted DNA-binding transcriptional regulator AlpA
MDLRQFDPMPLAREPQALVALLTLDQVAKTLGTSRAWVRDHATRRNPRIPVVRLGGKRAVLRFRPQDIENFITAHLQVQQGGV